MVIRPVAKQKMSSLSRYEPTSSYKTQQGGQGGHSCQCQKRLPDQDMDRAASRESARHTSGIRNAQKGGSQGTGGSCQPVEWTCEKVLQGHGRCPAHPHTAAPQPAGSSSQSWIPLSPQAVGPLSHTQDWCHGVQYHLFPEQISYAEPEAGSCNFGPSSG